MGERLAYAPSLGLALAMAVLLIRIPRWRVVLVLIALVYGGRTWARNMDWRDADAFYPKMLKTAPRSAKALSSFGSYVASRGETPKP